MKALEVPLQKLAWVYNSEHIPRMDSTKLSRVINPRAQDRLLWNALLTKPRKADTS